MAQVVRGQRRLTALQMAYLLFAFISMQITAVALVKPEAAAAFTAFAALVGAAGLALTAYFSGDAYAKGKGTALPDQVN